MKAQLTALTQRVGNETAMRVSSSGILTESLADTNRDNPSALSSVLASLVVTSMKRQIRNSTDDVIEIMYPITGRMITASIKGSISALAERINKQVEATLPFKRIGNVIRARVDGQTPGERLIASSLSTSIELAMIIDKASGRILGVWDPYPGVGDKHETRDENPELVNGQLAVLNNLAEEAFEASAGGLRTLELDGRQICLRSSASHMLVMELSGMLSAAKQTQLDADFIELVDSAGIDTALGPCRLSNQCHSGLRIGCHSHPRTTPATGNNL